MKGFMWSQRPSVEHAEKQRAFNIRPKPFCFIVEKDSNQEMNERCLVKKRCLCQIEDCTGVAVPGIEARVGGCLTCEGKSILWWVEECRTCLV